MSNDNFNKKCKSDKNQIVMSNKNDWIYRLAKLDSHITDRYAKLHRQLARSGATQTSKLNLVKEFENVQAQIQCLSDSIRYMEKNAALALLNAEQ